MRISYPRDPHRRAWRGTEPPGGGETGKSRRACRFAVLALAVAALLAGCETSAGRTGGGTETETVGVLRNVDGSPAVGALVRFRPVDYLADSLLEGKDAPDWETTTDRQGRFNMRKLAPGAYRLHADGGNGRGLVQDIFLERPDQRLVLDPDTLRPHGSIAGRIVLDTTADLQLHVQVYGMEKRLLADPGNGSFMVNDLPPGRYKLRFLGIGPYRRQAVATSEVRSETVTRLDSMVLDETAKLTFRIDSAGALAIDGLGPRSPVIFDNELWDNGPDNEYIWAKASAGELDLRGNVVTDAMTKGGTLQAQLAKAEIERGTALLAGLRGIPEAVAGATRPLESTSGPLERIAAETTAGSELIVAEALKCTPDSPLVVVAGGPLTTVANAYLADNSIASRMIVIAIYPFSLNSGDTVSTYVVAKRCRLVVWGRNYIWKGSLDQARIAALPGSRMGERLKAFHTANARAGYVSLGDLAPVAYLFDRRVWTSAGMQRFAPPLSVQPASDLAFDFLDIPEDGNDWSAYPREFFAAFANAAAFAPVALPGRVEAEGYAARSGARGALTAPGSAPDTSVGDAMAGQAGAWLDFRIAATVALPVKATVRYRSNSGGRLGLSFEGRATVAEIGLPAVTGWVETEIDFTLEPGAGILRVKWTEGAADLDWIGFEGR